MDIATAARYAVCLKLLKLHDRPGAHTVNEQTCKEMPSSRQHRVTNQKIMSTKFFSLVNHKHKTFKAAHAQHDDLSRSQSLSNFSMDKPGRLFLLLTLFNHHKLVSRRRPRSFKTETIGIETKTALCAKVSIYNTVVA